MACSKPILANLDGEGAKVVLEAECGLVSPSEDFMSFSKSIVTFLKLSSDKKQVMGKNARLYFERLYNEFSSRARGSNWSGIRRMFRSYQDYNELKMI